MCDVLCVIGALSLVFLTIFLIVSVIDFFVKLSSWRRSIKCELDDTGSRARSAFWSSERNETYVRELLTRIERLEKKNGLSKKPKANG